MRGIKAHCWGSGVIDLALWLHPLDGENPSGEELRNDSRFHELERLTEPQVKVVHDDRNRPSSQMSIPVDWGAVLDKADELRRDGRDLRLLIIVTRALANQHGLAGLTEGLTLIAQTLELHWETLHPALRPGVPPREAALRRVNALRDLQLDGRNGRAGVLADLRQTIFFAPRGVGPIVGRDLEQGALDERTMLQEATQGLNGAEKAALSNTHEQLLARLRNGFLAQADQEKEVLTALSAQIEAAISALDAVETALAARLGDGDALGGGAAVPELRRFLELMRTTLERGTGTRAIPNTEISTAPEPQPHAPNGNGVEAPAPRTSLNGAALPDRIASRDDVIKCLDLVVAFYDRTEPSSPIPHLARRIRRMVPMDFIELMEDLAPSGLKEFRLLAGVPDTRKTAQKDER